MLTEMLNEQQRQGVDAYIKALETLTPQNVREIGVYFHEDFRFIDPFNDLTGIQRGIEVFEDIYTHAQDMSFDVHKRSENETGLVIHWIMTVRMKPGLFTPKDWTFSGLSEIDVAVDGRILKHHDHWDAGSQFYAFLPVVGPMVRAIKGRVALKSR